MKKLFLLLNLILSLALSFSPFAHGENYLAGELPAADKIQTVLSAGNPSDLLLLALAPEKLKGLAGFNMQSPKGKAFPAQLQQLPMLGKIAGKGSSLSSEQIIALKPQLIVDLGNVTPNYQQQAQRTFQQTHVPYLLLDGALQNTPQMLLELGKILGKAEIARQQADYAQQTLTQAQAFAQNVHQSAYLARGANGLQTGQKGSIHTEAMELLGLRNVVEGENQGMAQVSFEQLLLWNPDIILTQYPEFYLLVQQDPQWQALSAVKNKKVFLIPNQPFGWLDSPPSLNRLLGIRWLQHLLSAKEAQDFAPEVQKFYQLFYHIELSQEDAKQLLIHE